ncbi:Surface polysaccharide O-acyltransferase, integral membrane enzyme [Halobacillus karajensis]|uniref:Acyltransferase family protein n=1 Tax=Halobacillus karajensis TaxID=195088 RepID=A0A024P326_9BACI|nr:acyltransferase [Halobacillus karajensis]CDQ19177.1 Acyltransferase family protein [Halobacillus karajensis]CDQ22749.1 Acyltransferase family protein [Halobacillus karajensis]CDQ26231.1 Acyltransferase family protein [Halobacillus karajensis]SEH40497.1 Surface polysaccharide O-acyltransferase, integral membrane enzyme [Halobacillus karajensis]
MAREKIESIFLLRLFAMMMVVLVHVTAVYASVLPAGGDAYEKYHFINRIVRIEAGIFIMITAMVFFYKYIHEKMDVQELKTFYKKRALYIVVPYLVWALFYEAFSIYIGAVSFNISEIGLRILKGESFYQLHFIFLIVQFYLFFPAILFVAKKIPIFKKYMWLFGIVIELGYYFLNQEFQFIPFTFFLSSMGPYLLGAWIGVYFKEQKRKIYNKSTYVWTVLAITTGIGTVTLHYHLYTVPSMHLPGWIYLVINLIYIMSGSYLMFRLMEIACRKWPQVLPYIKNVAIYSFGFYLLHPIVLKVVAQFIPMPGNYWFHAAVLLRFVVTLLACYTIIWLTHRYFPLPGLIFGKLPKEKPAFLGISRHSERYEKVRTSAQ